MQSNIQSVEEQESRERKRRDRIRVHKTMYILLDQREPIKSDGKATIVTWDSA
jgi:hypothetical protein